LLTDATSVVEIHRGCTAEQQRHMSRAPHTVKLIVENHGEVQATREMQKAVF